MRLMRNNDDRLRWYRVTYERLGGFSWKGIAWKAARGEKEALDILKKQMKIPYKVVKVETEEFDV